MTTRIRRTAEQIANDLEARARVARTKVKNMERAKQTRTAIIAGEAIRAMVNSGHANAKLVWDEMLAGLKRDQDRKAFGLESLPEEPLSESDADPLAAALARRQRAFEAWKHDKSPAAKVEVGGSMAACERLTGVIWDTLPLNERADWGLSDRPGELLSAS